MPDPAHTAPAATPVGSAASGVSEPVEPMTSRAWQILLMGSMTSFLTSLALSVMFVAFADLRRAFPNTSPSTLSWVLNLYTIVAAATLIVSGSIADRYGRKRTLLIGMLLFIASSIGCALSPTPGWLIAMRVPQAVATSLMTPSAAALILNGVPASRRGFAMAVWGTIGGAAAAAGPTLGALLIDTYGWPWAFWLNVPSGIVLFVFGWRVFRESKDADVQRIPDPLGAVALTVGVAAIVLALIESPKWGWIDVRTLVSMLFGLGLCAWLWRRCGRYSNPLFDVTIWRFPLVRLAALTSFTFGAAFFAMFFAVVQFLTLVWGYSLIKAGLLMSPIPGVGAIGSAAAARYGSRVSSARLAALGGGLYATGALWLLLTIGKERNLTLWLIGLCISGVGGGIIWPVVFGAAVAGVPPPMFAMATAFNQTVQRVATALGVAIGVTVISGQATKVSGYRPLFGLMVIGGLACVAISTQLRKATSDPDVPKRARVRRTATADAQLKAMPTR